MRRSAGGDPQGFLNVDEIRPIGEHRVLALGWVHLAGAGGESLDTDYALLIGLRGWPVQVDAVIRLSRRGGTSGRCLGATTSKRSS